MQCIASFQIPDSEARGNVGYHIGDLGKNASHGLPKPNDCGRIISAMLKKGHHGQAPGPQGVGKGNPGPILRSKHPVILDVHAGLSSSWLMG